MKAKDLIRVLQALDPEEEVTLSLGNNDEYRAKCAKAELAVGDCLRYLSVDSVVVRKDNDVIWGDIIVQQGNIFDLDAVAHRFDEEYQEIKKS